MAAMHLAAGFGPAHPPMLRTIRRVHASPDVWGWDLLHVSTTYVHYTLYAVQHAALEQLHVLPGACVRVLHDGRCSSHLWSRFGLPGLGLLLLRASAAAAFHRCRRPARALYGFSSISGQEAWTKMTAKKYYFGCMWSLMFWFWAVAIAWSVYRWLGEYMGMYVPDTFPCTHH